MEILKENKNGILSAKLSGSIGEESDFKALFGSIPTELHVLTKDITRITSFGVKSWITFFTSLTKQGTRLKFLECSTAIVEQFNLISNFGCGGAVESLYVPYQCSKCKHEFNTLFKTEFLVRASLRVDNARCPLCGANAVVDEVLNEYLSFLKA